MKTETHRIRVNDRTCVVVIEQDDARVIIKVRHDKRHYKRLDKIRVLEWLQPIIEQFKDDTRALEIVDL